MTQTGEDIQHTRESRYMKFFRSPFFLAVTIGVPFCIFKSLFGITAFRVGSTGGGPLVLVGILVIAWAGIDLLMNIARAGLDLAGRGDAIEFCTLAQVGRLFDMPDVFLATDTFISFSIICYSLWSGWITLLNPLESYVWYAATTLNLISLSLVMVFTEFQLVRARRPGSSRR